MRPCYLRSNVCPNQTFIPPWLPAVWAWGGGVCDIPPKRNMQPPRELKYGFRQHRDSPGQLLFHVRERGGVREGNCCTAPGRGVLACLVAVPC